jgi:hypothetical protein
LRKRGCEGAEIAEDACRTLFGAPDFSLTEVMRRAFEGASTRGWVEHVGLMLSRPDTPLRLVMVGLPPDELFAALGELGWSGDVAALHRYQERLGELVSGYALAIDADAKLRPRVGIEWYLGERRRATVGQFLDRCVEMELARPEKAAAIIDWPGVVKREAAGDFWPPNLAAGELQFGLRSAFLRQLNHFKLVYADGMPAEMKAYFGLTHVWVKPSKGAPSESVARP